MRVVMTSRYVTEIKALLLFLKKEPVLPIRKTIRCSSGCQNWIVFGCENLNFNFVSYFQTVYSFENHNNLWEMRNTFRWTFLNDCLKVTATHINNSQTETFQGKRVHIQIIAFLNCFLLTLINVRTEKINIVSN